ncbi:MAG TPA: hypothetical protein VHK69_20350 [Chitinophagaceae bacterium]|jgi:hypothetical protein|nr:hypothetical protein [Chitinophagaceae bacterium]
MRTVPDPVLRERLGLYLSGERVNAPLAREAHVFAFSTLAGVYLMESDLYGNALEEGQYFLAFEGRAGLMGKNITLDDLQRSSLEDIKRLVTENHSG